MEDISRKVREGHKYIPGTANEVERQHVSEHETLQLLQRHALNNKPEEFYNLLQTIPDIDKQNDIKSMLDME